MTLCDTVLARGDAVRPQKWTAELRGAQNRRRTDNSVSPCRMQATTENDRNKARRCCWLSSRWRRATCPRGAGRSRIHWSRFASN